MNTSKIKTYAPKARRDFIAAVQKQAAKYGVTEYETFQVEVTGDIAVVNGKTFQAAIAPKLRKLASRVADNGYQQTMEQVAYSWFNRLVAIRYMELHDYLGHGRRVLSHPDHTGTYQILDECTDLTYGEGGQLPNLKHKTVIELKLDGTKDEELYRDLLLAQCHVLHKAMPFLFENIDDETELLLPENLTKTDSLIYELVKEIPEEDWKEVEIIGWLYQFYISEKKDEVIGKVVKSEDIPAATQLFTPNWIVKYMVQNSLGAQWLATYPHSHLKRQMEYYTEPAEQTDSVNAQLLGITPSQLNPEELTLIDPASGSGHILVEAYELFKVIYLERGYRQRDIPKLILQKNLFGFDIDQRAVQLTGFALMMKGRADDRGLFERGLKLNVMTLVDSAGFDAERLANGVDLEEYGLKPATLIELGSLFEHASAFGSLIKVPLGLVDNLPALRRLAEWKSPREQTIDWELDRELKSLEMLVKQAEMLADQFDAVVANPPYMGVKALNAGIKDFTKVHYPNAKSDLFACFIERGFTMSKATGHNAMVTMQSWMFLSSFQKMREWILREKTICKMAHMSNGVMGIAFGTVATILRNSYMPNYVADYSHTTMDDLNVQRVPIEFPVRNNRLVHVAQDEFKKVPGSPVAYWLSDRARDVFFESKSLNEVAEIKQGLATCNNGLFVRDWYEVDYDSIGFKMASNDLAFESNSKWFPYNKGGGYRKWFGNNIAVVNWQHRGSAIHEYSNLPMTYSGAPVRAKEYYFRPGITYGLISSFGFSARQVEPGFVFDVGGSMVFADIDDKVLLGFLSSALAKSFIDILNPTLNYQVGDVARLPILISAFDSISHDFIKPIDITKSDEKSFELSWDFQTLPLLASISDSMSTLESSYIAWITQNRKIIREMKLFEEESNRLFIDAYGLKNEINPEVPIELITLNMNPAYRYGGKLTNEEQWVRFRQDSIQELVSYAIGCMIGRYSLDETGLIYAKSGNQGFDPSRYNIFMADLDGIVPLTSQEWFKDDATNRFREFISVAWNKEMEGENLDFVAESLCLYAMKSKTGESSLDIIRRYLSTHFFKEHLKTYRKRPIYWLFSSGKLKAFECLVYLHRYNEGTLARMRTEYVIPLTAKLNSYVEKLTQDIDNSDSAAETKRMEKERNLLHKQQAELAIFDEKLRHYADRRINLDLDDGVKINYAKFGDLLSDVKAVTGNPPVLDIN